MVVKSVCDWIEEAAPLALQEIYDNAGLLVGNPQMEIKSVLITIDVTEAVIEEALQKGCNLIVAHHPLIFNGLKKLTSENEVQRCMLKAIQNQLAIYAAHTNLDNVFQGVSAKMAQKIGLKNLRILQPKIELLSKLIVYVPRLHAYALRQALFDAGAGEIGNYDACSFNMEGIGTFRAGDQSNPFVGEIGEFHSEPEIKIEIIIPNYLKSKIINALIQNHPYEEPAFDIIPLKNIWNRVGAGIVGELNESEDEFIFLNRIKKIFNIPVLRHTDLLQKKIKTVALCGGSGSSLLNDALAANADIFISADFKYHEFFQAERRILIADIGHYESEQFTKDIFYEIITKKIPTFAVQISDTKTNPINYL